MPRPITILDLAKSRGVEEQPDGSITEEAFAAVRLPMLGSCDSCRATLGAYNGHPSRSGYWRCEECIGESGFDTAEEFEAFDCGGF